MIGNNLKYAREELEMTQTELGNVFGVSNSTVRGWENAYDTIPLNKLIKFCNLYNYSVDFIVGLIRDNKKHFDKININKELTGKRLKELRTKLGLTQQQIADECSISRATYCHYELGMNLVSTLTLYTICKNHKISMDSFLRQ
jgi:transcriptional regulator with XRE-family HTH domain